MELDDVRAGILGFFDGLEFDSHRYFVGGEPLRCSVSKLVEGHAERTDFGAIALRKDREQGLPEGTTKAAWDAHSKAACDRGTKIHLFAERWLGDKNLEPSSPEEEAVVAFWESVPPRWGHVLSELRMWHKEDLYAGTMDALLRDGETGEFAIVDYKTNRDLFKNFMGKTLLPPFDNLLDSPFNKYQVQLSYYQTLFEQTGHRVTKRKVVWLMPGGGHKVYDVEDLTGLLRQ